MRPGSRYSPSQSHFDDDFKDFFKESWKSIPLALRIAWGVGVLVTLILAVAVIVLIIAGIQYLASH